MAQNRRYFNDDTIAAIATAANAVGAIGIVRISGLKAWQAASSILKSGTGNALPEPSEIESHKMYRCRVVDGEGKVLDDALFVWMKAPHSFSGEDLIEIQQHGSPLLLQQTLEAIIKTGLARLAHPGEFSFRAFQNGKLDLSQAEAVMDLIASRSPKKAEQSLQNLLGSTKDYIEERKRELLKALAAVEVDIDFSDQGLSVIDYSVWADGLEAWCLGIERVIERYKQTSPLRDGIRVAIVGAPNSGKSTLFNRFLGEGRSIVSDIEGTTRDVIRESFSLGGLLFLLSDTAGLRSTPDSIEAEGIERSLGEIRGADLVLLVVDSSKDFSAKSGAEIESQYLRLKNENPDAKFVLVKNKADLLGEPNLNGSVNELVISGLEAVSLSARTGLGIDGLQDRVIALFSQGAGNEQDGFVIGRSRHSELLGMAAKYVRQAITKVRQGETLPDLLASDLRAAMGSMGEITGEVSSEDVLNFIFAEFCIGK